MKDLLHRNTRNRIFFLMGMLLLLLSVAAHAQPLVVKKTLTIRFIPVLAEEITGAGYTEGNMIYSSGITFREAYRVISASE